MWGISLRCATQRVKSGDPFLMLIEYIMTKEPTIWVEPWRERMNGDFLCFAKRQAPTGCVSAFRNRSKARKEPPVLPQSGLKRYENNKKRVR